MGSMTAEGEPVGRAADLGHQQIEIGGGEPPAIQDTHFQPGTLLEWADGSQEETKYACTRCAEPTRALHCRGAGKPWPLCHACYCEWGASARTADSNVDGNASDDAEMKEAVMDDGPNEDRHERSIVEQQDAATKVGTVMNRPKQQQKQEKSTQTEKLMRMEVKVEELTIESIRDRLRTTDLRLSGSKQQLADRLTENSTW